MPTVRTGPIIALITQVGLLVILDSVVGLDVAGWIIGIVSALTLAALLMRGLHQPFQPADWVTMIRATLVGCVTALAVHPRHTAVIVGITTVALILDAVDGQVARRSGTVTAFGARFDMEVDAFLILVLSVLAARSMGVWVLAIGLMRYAFVFFSRVLPWMRASTPPRYWCKVVAAIQGIVLTVAVSGLFPTWFMIITVLGALALLVESFGRDIVWLWYHREVKPLQQRLREALPSAMKSGDRTTVSALRSIISAIDNAEAVDRPAGVDKSLAIGQLPVGVGAAEMARRELSDAEVEDIVRAELEERQEAAQAYAAAGRHDASERLRAEILAVVKLL